MPGRERGRAQRALLGVSARHAAGGQDGDVQVVAFAQRSHQRLIETLDRDRADTAGPLDRRRRDQEDLGLGEELDRWRSAGRAANDLLDRRPRQLGPGASECVSARLQRAPIEIAGGAEAIEVRVGDRAATRRSERARGEEPCRGDQLVLGAVDLVERGGAGELEAPQRLLVAEVAQHDGGDADQARDREQNEAGVDRDQRRREADATRERAPVHRPNSRY